MSATNITYRQKGCLWLLKIEIYEFHLIVPSDFLKSGLTKCAGYAYLSQCSVTRLIGDPNSLTPQLPNSATPEILNFCSVFVSSASLHTQKPSQKFRISGVEELRSLGSTGRLCYKHLPVLPELPRELRSYGVKGVRTSTYWRRPIWSQWLLPLRTWRFIVAEIALIGAHL